MKPRPQTNRRKFLQTAAAASAAISVPTFIPAHVLGKDGAVAPSNKHTLGVIGIGPRCTYDLKAMMELPDVKCVAIADVQKSRREKGKELVDSKYGNTDCKLYRDLRELLDRKDIDCVLIATGDRWHAPASILAAKAGKDIYSEKPCGITIAKCQELSDVIKQTGRVFQAGTQRRSVTNFIEAVKLAHSGKLGKLHTLHASVYTPSWDSQWLPAEPTPTKDVCDWNLWLGPCNWRPFNQQYVNGRWRGHWDFDSGARLLDWAAHTVDLCQWANKADETLPITYEPDADKITCTYANGVKLVMTFLKTPFGERPGWIQTMGTCPVRFEGDAGSVETGDSGQIEIKPAALKSEIAEIPKKTSGLDVGSHARNFFDCVKTRGQTACNAQVMRKSHIAGHAAALCWILGRKLTIDPAKEEFVNDDEANMLRSRSERDPFKV